MRAKDLTVNGIYRANVRGTMRLVKLIGTYHSEQFGYSVYYVRNLETGRELQFRSPRKFQPVASQEEK